MTIYGWKSPYVNLVEKSLNKTDFNFDRLKVFNWFEFFLSL